MADRLAVGRAAGAVDGLDGDRGQSELLGGFDDAGAAAALVFHLVVEFGDFAARALGREFLLDLRGDAFIGRRRAGLDLADLDQRHAEAALAPAG